MDQPEVELRDQGDRETVVEEEQLVASQLVVVAVVDADVAVASAYDSAFSASASSSSSSSQ